MKLNHLHARHVLNCLLVFQIDERKSVAAIDYQTLASSPQAALTEVCCVLVSSLPAHSILSAQS